MMSWRVGKSLGASLGSSLGAPLGASLGVAGAIVLCGAIGAGTLRAATPAIGVPLAAEAARPAEDAVVHQQTGNPLWAVPLSSLRATHERPMFSSSRRPPSPPIVAAVAPPEPLLEPPPAPQRPSLILVGTVSGPSGGMAVFTDTATSVVVRLRMLEGHAGWILRSVTERAATLERDGQMAVLALPRRDSATAAPVASAGMAAADAPPPRIPLPVLRRP